MAIQEILVALLIPALGCGSDAASATGEVARSWRPAAITTVAGVSADDIRQAIQRRLNGVRPQEISIDRWRHVRRLYNAYNGAALWMESDGPNKPRTAALLRGILNANSDALRLDAYPLPELVQAVSTVRRAHPPTADQLAEADVLLSTTYVALAEDLMGGQTDPKQLSQNWHIATRDEGVDSAVAKSLRSAQLEDGIARMRPEYEDYGALQRQLVRFREIVTNGGWRNVPTGKQLKRGDRDSAARLTAVRQRLAAEGFAADSAGSTSGSRSTVYDRALAGAVADFQAHHGIVVDSILGDSTVQALNVPADYRLAQIAANLERLRWLPRDPGERYILVNVPAFRLDAYDSGRKALEMKVIVGEEYEGK